MKAKEDVSGNDVSGNDVLSDNELLEEVNRILNEKGYSGITADELAGNYNGQNTAAGDGTDSSTGTNNNTDTGTNQTNPPVTSTLSYYVTIEAPVGVEVYLDGNYIGITPCSFKKETGSHTLTLRNTGYVAKSYTIQIDEEEKNVSYSFLDLVKIE